MLLSADLLHKHRENDLDIGRAQLIYGLVIVYIGPYIEVINKAPNLFGILANVIFSLALILFGAVGGFVPSCLWFGYWVMTALVL